MNDDNTPHYTPGDIANGHRLGGDGQWYPLGNAPLVLPRPAGKPWFKRPMGIVGIVVGSLLLLSTCGAIVGASSGEKPEHEQVSAAGINNATAPSKRQWAQVVKDPDAHVGEVYVVYAQIIQFDSATGDDTFLADSANRNTMSHEYFTGENSMFTGKPRQLSPYVEDDVVVMTVEVDGSFSYDTQIGGNTTVPKLKVHKIARG